MMDASLPGTNDRPHRMAIAQLSAHRDNVGHHPKTLEAPHVLARPTQACGHLAKGWRGVLVY